MLFALARLGLGGPQIDSWWFPHRRARGIGAHPTVPVWSSWHRTGGHQRFSWIHMAVLRNEPELVLKSRWAVPRVLTEAGFVFAFPDLGPALEDVAASHRPRARDLLAG